ncbi:4-keto-6-deoxy-N-Acetyl-D-hexosaminyl-(Lipid carrier) aminotransferase [Indibacter alkaliphilus LW1]|uniref:4-keto-6-deoxy-N-Acetyl-D-hexosaminyl-(Lipid carrier) aminotransferase n=1 Tax=Indibacter alkaliphilus (strain CCUG 57479 / KCTC 22604 / LW1) TaxID=1189612 RepID=S2DFN1_INDAL|nr:DegT/DnrJ/EryC1/StrS family aminotransferase [Indibacter alkaliphilus]EOZ97744.1 4-keto-6-deoxy-N-Acetyl-D-hexosaminyl-(Lipid carrier) aminotransferase [Indibacter alkaliphilus LW1]
MNTPILLSSPIFDGKEQTNIQKALEKGFIATNGSFISKFEQKFSQRLKTHQITAVNSGTSALHLALIHLGVGLGDEVICQSFTFCASANPITYLGAVPVFVDSEKDTWNISPEILEDTILSRISKGKKPKAIITVDLFGMPAKHHEILEISKKYKIPVIEDAAEAVGSLYHGQPCGIFGELGVFSFNGNKIITTGGGGAVVSANVEAINNARYLSMQARENTHYYEHFKVGYNYRMNNISAGIGLAQFENLDKKVKKRRAVFDNYKEMLKNFEGISLLEEPSGVYCNRWLTTILIDPKVTGFSNEDLRLAFQKHNIESRFLWKPLHMQPVFLDYPYYGGNTSSSLFYKGICLPSSENLSIEDLERIVTIISKQFKYVFK